MVAGILLAGGSCSGVKNFYFENPDNAADVEAILKDKSTLEIGYTSPDSSASVTQNLTLPTTGANGTTISWVATYTSGGGDASSVVASNGTVNRPSYFATDAAITLTATLSKGTSTDTKVFSITVIKKVPQKILASDGAASDEFGRSVSVSGNYAIVGVPYVDSYKGATYVFEKVNGTWTEKQILTASDGAANDNFGCTVAISGDYAIIGAYGNDSYKGAAYIFERGNGTWSQKTKLSGEAADDYFGNSVSISGDYAIVGAYKKDNSSKTEQGAAYIFERDGSGNWNQKQKLLQGTPDGATGDHFGKSVSINDNFAVVGAEGYNSNQGAVYYFVRNEAGNWTQVEKLVATGGEAEDYFGSSVSISGNYVLVGAHLEGTGPGEPSARGAAYIFENNSGTWSQEKILASDGAAQDQFGYSVSISGASFIVGSHLDDDPTLGSNLGSAYIFRKDPPWMEKNKLSDLTSAGTHQYGTSVHTDGTVFIIGAPLRNETYDSQGAAYIYE